MTTRSQDVQEQYNNQDTNMANSMKTPPFMRVILSVATGIIFGIALEKGRVFEPQVIRDQMLFKRFAMMKMFLSASAIGMLSFSLLHAMPQTMRKMSIALQQFPGSLPLKSVGGVVIGAAILGSGMTIAGACPGTIVVQLGTGVENAWITVIGGLLGALVYSMTHVELISRFKAKKQPKFFYLDKFLDVPYASIAVPVSCVLAGAIFCLEMYSPWHTELDSSFLNFGLMRAGAWPPFIAGMIIGTLQIPTVLTNEDTLGTTSAYTTVMATIWPSSYISVNNEENYLKDYRYGLNNWWQVFHLFGALLGGALSATASNTMGVVSGLPWHHALTGGFLMLYGSRLAGGCTSGHGLSGFGLMALISFAAVPAIFGGGIATAFFMKYILNVDM